jgi:hypothetical protein
MVDRLEVDLFRGGFLEVDLIRGGFEKLEVDF